MKKVLNLIAIFLVFMTSVKASHVPGGNITYECIGNGQYVVTLTLYEDCGTAFESGGTQTIQIVNDCGIATPTTATLQNDVFQQEVSQLCQSQIGLSECNGGTLPGVYMHIWSDTITLPAQCDSWVFSYSSCCRNTSNNLVGSSDSYYWEAMLNSQTDPCNSAPVITAPPIPYVCANQQVNYNVGAYEPNGHTLVYSLINALTSPTAIVTYQGGFTGAVPIPGIAIDAVTGEITFTPTTTGNYVVAILIEEYDSNGNLVGSIIQDFQFEVINCAANNNPAPPASGISNFTGTGIQTGPTDVQLCEGDNVCFQIEFTDATADSLYLTSNATLVLPGATVTQLSYFSPAVIEICWTAPSGANPFSSITVTAEDNSCPIVGTSTMTLGVTVVTSTYAGIDEVMCLNAGVQLGANGGSSFNWDVISGDPIQLNGPNANFSCNNCQGPIANPDQTTIYEVTSNLAGGCTNVDTVTVTVVPDFTYILDQSSTSSCLNSDIQLEITPNPIGAYAYQWSPGTFLNSTTIGNPMVTPTTPGNYQYSVEITSPNGCIKNDTINLTVAAAYAPDVTVTVNTDSIFCGDTVFFSTDLGCGAPSISGPATNSIVCGAPVQQTIGTNCGANTSTGWPAPYGNWYRNAKHQFLFPASELQASGFLGGAITDIAWEITAINGTTTYNSYTIKIGTTATTSLTAWETGLTQVFGPQNVNIALGWNTHVLTTPYQWDGTSNVVVEICYDNLAISYTNNSITPWHCTTYNSSLYYRSDSQLACPATTQTTSINRPITRFNTVLVAPDPNNYAFSWPNTGGISSDSVQNPYAMPQVTTDYQLVVTDLNGGCTDTVNILIDVLCDTCYAPSPTLTNITCFGGSDGEILATPNGIYGPWTLILTDNGTSTVLQTDNNVVTNINYTGLSAGSYTIRSVDTSGCYADTIVTLLEPTYVDIAISNDTIVCIGGTGVLQASASNGNGVPYIYNWSQGIVSTAGTQNVNPAINTTYDVYVLDALGCSSDTLNMTVNLFPPILTTSTPDINVCPGDLGQVGVQANGGIGGTYFYEWTDEQGNVVGSANSISVLNTYSPQTYFVTVTDDCETPPTIDSVTVSWFSEPVVLFTADTLADCYPVNTTFTNTTDPLMVSSCFWDFGDGNTSAICGTASNTYLIPGEYSVDLIVTSPDGCVSNTTITNMITVYDYPTSYFTSDPNPTDVLHPLVNFTDSSSSDAVTWYWSFGENGELGNSTTTNPSLVFPDTEPGTYPVELIATNANGCSDTSMLYVVVNGVYNFYVPSAFTPDGDGINDYFFPLGESVSAEGYELRVFNRWGEAIFISEGMSVKWDGNSNSQPAELGVYVWNVRTIDSVTGELREYSGHVSLIR